MKLERISYQYADGTLAAYDFNPRLTVIDVHPAHRRALVDHLVAALSTTAPGVHVEATFESPAPAAGTSVVAFRPYGAAHRVIDVDSGALVTESYLRAAGHVDLLVPLGIDPATVPALLVGSAGDLALSDPTDQWIARLAASDPDTVIGLAQAAAASERELREATAAAKATPQLAAAVEGAYGSRRTASELERRHNRIRVLTLVVGSALPIGAVVGLNTIGNAAALSLIGGSIALAGGCLAYERRLARAVDAEYEALAAAGADSYVELDRLVGDSPVGDDGVRSRLLAAAERYRSATADWQGVAGDIPAPWAAAQATRIRSTAALRATLQPVPTTAHDATAAASSAALLDGLTRRSTAIAERTGGREGLPLFLDDPLQGLTWEDKVPVLEVLGRLSEQQQLVLATDDSEVLAWARLEAMAGTVAVVDVNPGRASQHSASSAAA